MRHESRGRIEVCSAGTEPREVHSLAIEAMREVGIDITAHRPKNLQDLVAQPFDYVITVCDQAAEACPTFPDQTTRIHWSFEDPSAAVGSQEERLAVFRRVRMGLLQRIRTFLQLPAIQDALARSA